MITIQQKIEVLNRAKELLSDNLDKYIIDLIIVRLSKRMETKEPDCYRTFWGKVRPLHK